MQKINIPIKGMHCRSCELLIEDKLKELPGVKRSVLNYKKGSAEIFYDSENFDVRVAENAIREAGYEIGLGEKKPFFSQNPNDYKELGSVFLLLMILYVIASNFGLTDIGVGSSANPSSLGVVFLVGITAGISTCMALVGGLILGISARHSEKHPTASAMQKFRPHLFFNAGRISLYAFFGGLLGLFGSFLQLSSLTLGILTIFVGVVMLILGLKLTGIFPRLENGGLLLPKGISRILGIGNHREYSHKNSFILGGLTFFLPCGFTQAMQLYAVSSGSFSQGALIMGLFALGTAPGLLSVGGLTSVIKGAFARKFFKFAGVLVSLLAIFNISNGYNLTGFNSSVFSAGNNSVKAVDDPNVSLENGVQVVRMTENSRGYSPNKFTIKKGVPVRWIIDAQAPYSCASSLVLNKMGIRKSLISGENVIEFTPKETGSLPFSCSMGMYTGVFTVVDDNGSAGSNESATSVPAAGGTCSAPGGGGGCGGCGGGSSAPVEEKKGKVENQNVPTAGNDSVQVIKTSYTAYEDINPNTFTVKVGSPVRFEIDVKEDGVGCMSSIMIPGLYNKPQLLEKGKKLVMEFTPTEKKSYEITCAMGMPRGTITVE